MAVVYKTPKTIKSPTGFCAGCGHGIVNRIFAEVLEELEVDEKTICALAVGCSCLMHFSFDIDLIQSPHGRAPAVATGIKRLSPDRVVITYQGDGDLCSIGCSEIIHAAARNEKITTIFVNNGVFGMTGGQMAPTTLPGQITSTSPLGRDTKTTGMPMRMSELISVFPVAYVARGSLHSVSEIRKTKKYIKKAVEAQLNNEGFSMVEILSPCPTNWSISPLKSLERIKDVVIPHYKMGELVNSGGEFNV